MWHPDVFKRATSLKFTTETLPDIEENFESLERALGLKNDQSVL